MILNIDISGTTIINAINLKYHNFGNELYTSWQDRYNWPNNTFNGTFYSVAQLCFIPATLHSHTTEQRCKMPLNAAFKL